MSVTLKNKKSAPRGKNRLLSVFREGDLFSKLSFLVMGLGNIARGQKIKGLIYLAIEIGYIIYMVQIGAAALVKMTTLGTVQQGMVFNEASGIYEVNQGDNSMLILLYGVVTCVITGVFICMWLVSIFSGEKARLCQAAQKPVRGILGDIRELFNSDIHKLLLAIPVTGILVFTVMPLIYMILMAFTSYDSEHQPPGNLFTWVGLENFKTLISSSEKLTTTFWPVLGWTLVWCIAATFSCYFGGMFLAILINSKGI
jgi:arabinogalactan oligomer/maltooligosaccharide transport system permease protein